MRRRFERYLHLCSAHVLVGTNVIIIVNVVNGSRGGGRVRLMFAHVNIDNVIKVVIVVVVGQGERMGFRVCRHLTKKTKTKTLYFKNMYN